MTYARIPSECVLLYGRAFFDNPLILHDCNINNEELGIFVASDKPSEAFFCRSFESFYQRIVFSEKEQLKFFGSALNKNRSLKGKFCSSLPSQDRLDEFFDITRKTGNYPSGILHKFVDIFDEKFVEFSAKKFPGGQWYYSNRINILSNVNKPAASECTFPYVFRGICVVECLYGTRIVEEKFKKF